MATTNATSNHSWFEPPATVEIIMIISARVALPNLYQQSQPGSIAKCPGPS
ncbi:MAG: hypothetical protein WC740_12985 [Verrucomicrobiia bacterium]